MVWRQSMTIAEQVIGNKYLFTPTRFKDYDLDVSDRQSGGSPPVTRIMPVAAICRRMHLFGLKIVEKK